MAPEKTSIKHFSRFHPGQQRHFEFLGFRFYWDVDFKGEPRLRRKTAPKKHKAVLKGFYQWIKDNFAIVETIIPENYLLMAPMIASGFCSDEMRDDAKAFFEPKTLEVPGMDRNLSQTLEKIEICTQTANRHKAQPLAL